MNKFLVFPCIKRSDEEGYSGPIVVLANEGDMSFALFFPVSEDNSKVINYILDTHPDKYTINDGDVLGIYKTMINSWEAGNRYLSGIHMDTEYNSESKQDIIATRIIISNEEGDIDSIIRVNFIHAIFIAAMERKEIMVTNDLLNKLIPDNDEENENENENENNDEDENDDENDDEDPEDPIINPDNLNKDIPKNKKLPVDKEILDIAKKIMTGKIK